MPEIKADDAPQTAPDGDAVLTVAQLRAAEAAAMANGVSEGDLMARAGAGAARAIAARWPAGRDVVVLCGSGANGGDGYVVARHLAATGRAVRVFAAGAPAAGSAAARMRDAWLVHGPVAPLGQAASATAADVLVDALLGVGVTRPLSAEMGAALAGVRAGATAALDCPSGLCLDSGLALGPARAADLTLSFHRAKLGHFLADGPALCGALTVLDIGLDGPDDPAAARLAALDWAALAKRADQHKYDHGHAVVLAGGVGRGGAARLAARAALRAGAGLVTLCPPPAALIENAARLDAIMLRAVADAPALTALLADRRINAALLGPGLGVGPRTRELTLAALAAGPAVVLDADALTSFADDPQALFHAVAGARVVLTPHEGEFRRLFPDLAPQPGRPATARVQAAARRSGACVLLKGPTTLVAAPQGPALLCAAVRDDAAPWLATAGSGDVLAGLVAGLLARGFAPLRAASTAALWHQAAGRAAGPGLIADDLPEAAAGVLRAALAGRLAPPATPAKRP